MEKIFERLLIEFLIPAFLMFFSILLAFDVLLEDSFDLSNRAARMALSGEPYWPILGDFVSYLLNTSLSSVLNLRLRRLGWGKIREYLLLRKLNVFKSGPFKDINWIGYLSLTQSWPFKWLNRWRYRRLTKVQRDTKLETVLTP